LFIGHGDRDVDYYDNTDNVEYHVCGMYDDVQTMIEGNFLFHLKVKIMLLCVKTTVFIFIFIILGYNCNS